MKVHELLLRLTELPNEYDEYEIVLGFNVSTGGGCCCSSGGDEWEERFVESVDVSSYKDSEYTTGPRGGSAKWRIVDKPCLMITGTL